MIAINIICLAFSSWLVLESYKHDLGYGFWFNTFAVLINLAAIIVTLLAS